LRYPGYIELIMDWSRNGGDISFITGIGAFQWYLLAFYYVLIPNKYYYS